jgi:hypothetical protein
MRKTHAKRVGDGFFEQAIEFYLTHWNLSVGRVETSPRHSR